MWQIGKSSILSFQIVCFNIIKLLGIYLGLYTTKLIGSWISFTTKERNIIYTYPLHGLMTCKIDFKVREDVRITFLRAKTMEVYRQPIWF